MECTRLVTAVVAVVAALTATAAIGTALDPTASGSDATRSASAVHRPVDPGPTLVLASSLPDRIDVANRAW